MLPEELYKRRRNHNNTPPSALLILANYIVFAVATEFWATCTKINSFYWAVLAGLAIYNFFTIRRNREEYLKPQVIAYVISLAGLLLLFFLFRSKAQNC